MTTTVTVGFCVIYRFRVHDDKRGLFERGWALVTEATRQQRGGLGSRLHVADDGWFVAYAQWPDRLTWERSQSAAPASPAGSDMMNESIAERIEPLLLEPVNDLLARV